MSQDSGFASYYRMLVPLDGSPLAEDSLAFGASFARIARSEELILLRLVEEGQSRDLCQADSYLRDRAIELLAGSTTFSDEALPPMPRVEWVCLEANAGEAASSILRFAEEKSVDLITMSTHGRSGVQRWLLGSVAEKVVRGADVPVLLVRASGTLAVVPARSEAPRCMLVPLDGSSRAEAVLPYVKQLARYSSDLRVTLLCVVPDGVPATIGGLGMGIDHGSGWRDRASMYLASVCADLASSGIKAEAKVRLGRPGLQITEAAEQDSVDLIAMGSHGDSAADSWAFGTVADQVLHNSPVPVLLVPTSEPAEAQPHLQGAMVYQCQYCGRSTNVDKFTSMDRCTRCHNHLKSRPNCVFYDGMECTRLRGVPSSYPCNECSEFQFKTTPVVLR